MTGTDATHDPELRSWIPGATDPATDFPVQNLPLGAFVRPGDRAPRLGVAIGAQILDLREAVAAGLLSDPDGALSAPTLNPLMAQGAAARRTLRERVSALLRASGAESEACRAAADRVLVPMAEAEMRLPAEVGDYTDFFASIHHASNAGAMLRPDNPLLPNYKWVPVAYHGRASTVVPSGAPVRRPKGQRKPADAPAPSFGPSRNLDYELEVGIWIGGPANPMGEAIPMDRAEERIFGLCLLNDWSARDVQGWEYQPLGPFLAKNFATTISPWVVTAEALGPFRAPRFTRAEGDPAPLSHLNDPQDAAEGAFDLAVEALLLTPRMRSAGEAPVRLSRAAFRDMYWTPAQMVAHHASNGCALRPGDLFGSGTVSGPTEDSRGCLLELTWRGSRPLTLPNGETRRFLEDGDEVILRARCERPGFVPIGFGECRGTVLPAAP